MKHLFMGHSSLQLLTLKGFSLIGKQYPHPKQIVSDFLISFISSFFESFVIIAKYWRVFAIEYMTFV
jgi:hypothetical protein